MKIILLIMLASVAYVESNCRSKYVSSSLKRDIVNIHNRERRVVREKYFPTKGNQDLTWSNELARMAKRFIDRCDTEQKHASNAELNGKGENLAGSSTTEVLSNFPSDSKYTRMVEKWMAEKEGTCDDDGSRYPWFNQPLSQSNFQEYGHYTQAIWWEATKVGCAIQLLQVNKYKQANDGSYATFRTEYRLNCIYDVVQKSRQKPVEHGIEDHFGFVAGCELEAEEEEAPIQIQQSTFIAG